MVGEYGPRFFNLFLEVFKSNTTSDWLDCTNYPISSCVTCKFAKKINDSLMNSW